MSPRLYNSSPSENQGQNLTQYIPTLAFHFDIGKKYIRMRRGRASEPKTNYSSVLAGILCFHHTVEDHFSVSSLSWFMWDFKVTENLRNLVSR